MKCPICGSELIVACEQDGIAPNPNKGKVYCMSCDKCNIYGEPKLWQELTKIKQALDVAVDALKDNLSQANFRQMLDASRFHAIITKCECALDQIKQITEIRE